MRFVYDGSHPQDIAGGRMLAPGDEVDLSAAEAAHPDNKRLVDAGKLRKQRGASKPKRRTKSKGSDQ